MLKFFRYSYVAQLVVIVLLTAALWMPVFIQQPEIVAVENPTTPLYNFIANILGFSHVAFSMFVFVIFIVTVFFFNSMLSVNQLVTRNSSIGALMMVIFMCCVPLRHDFYPFLMACPLIMIAIQTIYLIYLVDKPESYLMNAGLFLSVASMVYLPSIILIIWVLLSMSVMNFKEFRHYVIPVVGFIMPYFLLFVYFYFSQTLIENIDAYSLIFNNLHLTKISLTTLEIIMLLVFGVIFVWSIFRIQSGNADHSVSTTKKVRVTMLLLLFGLLMLFMQSPVMYNGLILLVLAIFASMALCYVKKSRIIDIIIVVMIFAVVALQYLPIFGIRL